MLDTKQVVKLTGATSKALRYWEAQGLLTTVRADNDYRLYSPTQLTKIFYIMSLRRLDLPISEIREILSADKDEKSVLTDHLKRLRKRQLELTDLIDHLDEKLEKGDYQMTNKDFESWKRDVFEENEKTYGLEIREKYGEAGVAASSEKFLAQTESEMKWAADTHEKIVELLEEAYVSANKEKAQEAVQLHATWLAHYWSEGLLSAESHKGLGDMYVADERFRKNYDRTYAGLTEYFRDAIYDYYD